MDFAVRADLRVKVKESEKKDKFLDLARGLVIEHESDDETNCNCCTRYSHQSIGTRTGEFGNKRTSRDHPS